MKRGEQKKLIIYLIAFLAALNLGLPLYIASSFLARIVGETRVAWVYAAGALGSLVSLAVLPPLLRRFGNYRLLTMALGLHAVALVALAFTSHPLLSLAAIIVSLVVGGLIFIHLDIFLEHASRDLSTGRGRGEYLTAINVGVLISPLIAGLIVGEGMYPRVFLAAAVVLIPLFFAARHLRAFRDPFYDRVSLGRIFRALTARKDIRLIALVNLSLQVFYVWMVVYLPIYVNAYAHFSWGEIGIIFSIMLLPFIFLEYPLGILADQRFGEKEILAFGFAVMGIATAILSFLPSGVLWIWALTLLATRLGAAAIEIMSEAYFFKKIDATDAHLISIFRMTRPVGYLVGPLAALAALAVVDTRLLFFALGLLMLPGIPLSLALKDTR